MPRPDPVPTDASPLIRRFRRIARLLILLAAVVAALAVALVARGGGAGHLHLLIATGVGVFMTMIVGTGLMTLVFLSASSGHDDAAGETHRDQTHWKDD